MAIENKRYNRIETTNDHFYSNDFGTKGVGNVSVPGYIKCRLAHADGYSVIVPDQAYFEFDDGWRWLQPFAFFPCVLAKFDDDILCDLRFDISSGYMVRARLRESGYVRSFEDGSQLYRCEMLVPDGISDYCIGKAEVLPDQGFLIELFHHTTDLIVKLILESQKLIGSKWNIQGNTPLAKSEHVYFTPLHEIKTNSDLERIAMSETEEIRLLRDNFVLPRILSPGWEDRFKNEILTMKVYRESRRNRSATLSFMVPAEYVAPQHILKHSPKGDAVYYEISAPFIQRVQIPKAGELLFSNGKIGLGQAILNHEFVIIGDATTLDGLKAPFDEENTKQIFKIDFLPDGKNFLSYWFENGNSNLFSRSVM